MTKKQELLDFITTLKEDEELFCIQILENEEETQEFYSFFKMEEENMIEFFENKYNDDLISEDNLQIISWKIAE
jgi:hypothetical protein